MIIQKSYSTIFCRIFFCIGLIYFLFFQEWELLDFPAVRNEYDYQGDIFIDLVFTLNIRRRTLYYFSNLILPCVLIGK